MGIKKNLKKLMSEPTEMKIKEVQNILKTFGFMLDRVHGSHYIFIKPECDNIILPVHNKKVTKHYLIDLKELIQTFHE